MTKQRHDQLEERIRQRWLKKRDITVTEHVVAEMKELATKVRKLRTVNGVFSEVLIHRKDMLDLLKEAVK